MSTGGEFQSSGAATQKDQLFTIAVRVAPVAELILQIDVAERAHGGRACIFSVPVPVKEFSAYENI